MSGVQNKVRRTRTTVGTETLWVVFPDTGESQVEVPDEVD